MATPAAPRPFPGTAAPCLRLLSPLPARLRLRPCAMALCASPSTPPPAPGSAAPASSRPPPASRRGRLLLGLRTGSRPRALLPLIPPPAGPGPRRGLDPGRAAPAPRPGRRPALLLADDATRPRPSAPSPAAPPPAPCPAAPASATHAPARAAPPPCLAARTQPRLRPPPGCIPRSSSPWSCTCS